MRRTILTFLLGVGCVLCGKDIFVDYNVGQAANPGTREAPHSAIAAALKHAAPGDTIHILPSPRPIRDNLAVTDLRGTAEKPIVIDGGNNVFLGTNPLKSSEWHEVAPGLYKKEMTTGKNWASRFFLTFNGRINRMGRIHKAGSGGAPYKRPEDLAPGEWTVVQREAIPEAKKSPHPPFRFEFFVRLPDGRKSLTESGVEEPNIRKNGGVNLRGKCRNLIFRNLIVKNFFNDGYNLHGDCRDIHFENVAAVDCGDDGISAHEECTLTGKNMVFIGCSTAICHIQGVTSVQENVYAEKISGRELFFLKNSHNTVKDVYMIADSFSGSLWTNRKGDRQTAALENVFAVSSNPRAVFTTRAGGELKLTAANVRVAGFHKVMQQDGVTTADPAELRKVIAAKRAELFARFGGNLEKALE